MGVNCRHSFSPFYPGISTPRWSPETLAGYAEKQYAYTDPRTGEGRAIGAYAASQTQRRLERAVRGRKRIIAAKKAAGVDVTKKEKDDLKEAKRRLARFLDDTGLRRQPFREQI